MLPFRQAPTHAAYDGNGHAPGFVGGPENGESQADHARPTVNPSRSAEDRHGVDDRHRAVLQELLQRPTWSAEELKTITARVGLMPWACFQTLNAWARKAFGDLLLDGDEIVNVNLTLKEKIRA